jgi:DNA-binding transcriptional MerR regulator
VGQGFQAGTSQILRIGELASRAAMSVDAIRFYEKRGLLPKAQRSAGQFRVYSPRDLEHVRFIRQTQALGFSLREIRELVDLRDRKTEACKTVENYCMRNWPPRARKRDNSSNLRLNSSQIYASAMKN